MGKRVSEKIIELREEIEKLKPTEEEVLEYGKNMYNCKGDYFIADNTWRTLRIGENFHIHIGFKTDFYLDVEEAKDFIKWLKKKRGLK